MPSLLRRLAAGVGGIVRRNHMSPPVIAGARLSRWYLASYWNDNYWNLNRNGESLLLRNLAAEWGESRGVTVFDVGANTGSYAALVRRELPNSTIHCFEAVPRTRERLKARVAALSGVVVSECGLSDCDTRLEIGYSGENDKLARVVWLGDTFTEIFTCDVRTGDGYAAEHGIEAVDLLKVDTEGHEVAVLAGFQRSLDEGRIRAIQFEYGLTWIPQRRFLHEAYALLEPAGFRLGRLFPDGVFFKRYNHIEDDHFRMGNYVAIHESCSSLIERLNLNRNERRSKLGRT